VLAFFGSGERGGYQAAPNLSTLMAHERLICVLAQVLDLKASEGVSKALKTTVCIYSINSNCLYFLYRKKALGD